MCAPSTLRPIATLCVSLLLVGGTLQHAHAQEQEEEDAPVYEDDLEAEASGAALDEEGGGDEVLTPGEIADDEPARQGEETEGVVGGTTTLVPAFRWRLGPRIGVGYNRLFQPTDPAGSTTLLRGSAFAGVAFQLGAQAGYALWRRSTSSTLWLDFGAHYGWMRGAGYVENPERTKRQTVKLTGHTLRVPLLLRFDHAIAANPRHALFFGLGAEVLLGLASSAQVLFEQIAADPEPLYTTPVTHIGLLTTLGATLHLRDGLSLPIGLQLTYDPMVRGSTEGRFEGYQSMDEPGAYQVAFNLHLHLVAGLEWRF